MFTQNPIHNPIFSLTGVDAFELPDYAEPVNEHEHRYLADALEDFINAPEPVNPYALGLVWI